MADKDAKAPEEDVNIWKELLAKSSVNSGWDTSKIGTSTLIVLGDRLNGKSSVLNKIKDRVTDSTISEYILDYSYINVRNKFNLDKDEVVSRMSVWQLDDVNHSDLLTKLVKPSDLKNTQYVITVDLSKPSSVLESLNKWLAVVKDMNEKIITQLSAEAQTELKTKISTDVQTYVDPGVTATTAAAVAAETEEAPSDAAPNEEEATPAAEGDAGDDESGALAIDPALPATNLGVPIIILGTKADYFNRVLAKTGADEKFEFVTQRIRKVALEYGATTIFTSAVGEGHNVETFEDHVFTRIVNKPNPSSAKVIGSAEDIAIYCPAGFDSLELIESGSTAKSGWNDETKLEDIFGKDANSAAERKDELITAMDNDTFFKALRAQIDKGVPFSPSTPVAAGKAEQQKYVKSFFKSLLNSDKKKKEDA